MAPRCGVWALILAATVAAVVADLAEGGGGSGGGGGIATRPSRPRVFTSPEELRQYLAALSNYYAIEGRPRFGKRAGGEPLSAPPSFPVDGSSFSSSPYGGAQSFHSTAARDLLDLLTERN